MDLEQVLKLLQDRLEELQDPNRPSDGNGMPEKDYSAYYALGLVFIFFSVSVFFNYKRNSPPSGVSEKDLPKVYNKAVFYDKARVVSFPGMTKEELDKLPDVYIYNYYLKKKRRRVSRSRYYSSKGN